MKIKKLIIEFDNGATINAEHPTGFDVGDILGSIGNLPGDQDDPTSLKGLLMSFASLGVSLLMKRIGL